MASVLYSFSQADDHQIRWGTWEQSSWVSVRRWLRYDVALTGRDADWPQTHNSRYPHRLLGLHQSYTHRTQRPPTMSFLWLATARLAHPQWWATFCVISRLTLTRNTHADWDEGKRSDTSRLPVDERILAMKALGAVRQKNQVHIKHMNLYFSRRQQWKVALHCDFFWLLCLINTLTYLLTYLRVRIVHKILR